MRRLNFRIVTIAFLLSLAIIILPYRFWLTTTANTLIQLDPLRSADVAVVELWNCPSLELMRHAAELYRNGSAKKIILLRYTQNDRLTRAGISIPEKFDEILDLLSEEVGLDSAAVEKLSIEPIDPVTLNTAEQVRRHAVSANLNSIVVITSLFHSRRSALAYKEIFKSTNIAVSTSAPVGGLKATNWWETKDGMLSVVEEFTKLQYYRLFYL